MKDQKVRDASNDRFCASCGMWKRMYFKVRDPHRSLCIVCYYNPEIHHRFGKGYMGPRATPPHPNVTKYLADPSFGPEDGRARPAQLVWNPEERKRQRPPWWDRMDAAAKAKWAEEREEDGA